MAGRGAADDAEDRAHWARRSACANEDIDRLFVRGKAQNEAKKVCRTCPVALQCLAEALDNHVEFGVWGGLTERERRALLRRRPDVTSWHDLLLGIARGGTRAG
ncbi:MAG TPA: WhiB family transcriptional regulator [Tetrasphaera sp.]|uniref:WhiB family transcriptional regulator n=1 Tax=Nostocoides sp. TaxID=1917966 RepID=UPI002CC52527|nr:WhiB family transcriptional regulator [Tetrasphaera sp.]HNQ07264.1 WhiB family transcriptional regulator [Tetrasphaera sp.]